METAVIVEAVRTATGKGKPGGGLSGLHAVELLRQSLEAVVERSGDRPRGGRGRHGGLRQPGRRAGRLPRPARLARRRLSLPRARHHHRPPLRLEPAGGALRRAGRDVGLPRRRGRRRRREHEPRADGLGARGRRRLRAVGPGALRTRADLPGRGRRAGRGALEGRARGDGRLRGPLPRPRRGGPLLRRLRPRGGRRRPDGRHLPSRRTRPSARARPPRSSPASRPSSAATGTPSASPRSPGA